MKRAVHMLSVLLLALSVALCFAPAIAFYVAPSAIEDALGDLTKQQGKVQKEQDKLNELTQSGADASKVKKQRDKAAKAQAKCDELAAEIERVTAASSGAGATMAMARLDLPEGLALDNIVINGSGVYKPYLEQYRLFGAALLGLLALSALLTALCGRRLVSRWMTLAAVMELAAVLLAVFMILRVQALPIKAPYGGAQVSALGWAVALAPLLALGLNVASMYKSGKAMIYIFCAFLSVLSIFPFWIMIVDATRSTIQIQQGISLIPGRSLVNNWNILMGKNFDVAMGLKNSAVIAFGATLLSVYFSALCAYGLTAYEFRGRKALFSFIVGIIMIPTQVSSIGFYMYMYKIGWTDSFLPLILPAVAAPATVFFIRQYLQANFQVSLVEASRIDGAGEFSTYNRIVIPILMPAMATMAIMSVITSWNDYLKPLMLLKDPKLSTLPMMVRTLRGDIYRTEYGSIYMGLTLTALPLLIVYFALSKYIIQGVALGGVKE